VSGALQQAATLQLTDHGLDHGRRRLHGGGKFGRVARMSRGRCGQQ
jgi:hypothetical protein